MSVAIICQPMLILSLDTTTRAGSCALLGDGGVIREQTGDDTRDQAERLPRDLATLLEREAVSLQAIDAFAVATGPGSFTGLRVGIATMQGLAMATGKALIGVSAFDALASLAAGGSVAAWIDAWRGEVYAAVYENGVAAGDSVVAAPDVLIDVLAGEVGGSAPSLDSRSGRPEPGRGARNPPHPIVFTGDGAALHESRIRERLGAHARFTSPVAPPLAGAVATLAARAFRNGDRPLPHAIRPIYVRRSDAELAADRKDRLRRV
jgi:tRNA threonylcarbamoyladenosine biosynthesis protein TsaB